jgi:hypothetical protein
MFTMMALNFVAPVFNSAIVSLISFMLEAVRFTPTQRLPCIIAYSIFIFQSYLFKQCETFSHLLVPAEGNAPSLAHLGQAVGLRLTL